MNDEVQLISDGDGLAVIGDRSAVERFLSSEGLESRELGLSTVLPRLGTVAATTQIASDVAANSGRWVKLTKDSAAAAKKYGLRDSGSGLSTGVLKGDKGQIRGFVEFAKGPGTMLTNPAVLAGAAGIMAQVAMQQAMDDITEYLAVIDAKVDDVLRAQKDAALAEVIGVDLVVKEAMTIREAVGRVSDVTWSKLSTAPFIVSRTQAYALRQLDGLAEKLEKGDVGDLDRELKRSEGEIVEWLAVLAFCVELHDALAILELDRVLDSGAGDLDRHRLGLKTARRERLSIIGTTTARLIERMQVAATRANEKVLTNPWKAPSVVRSVNSVSSSVAEFHGHLGLDTSHDAAATRGWRQAASDLRDRVVESGADGLETGKGAARRIGSDSRQKARVLSQQVSRNIGERPIPRWRRSPRDQHAGEGEIPPSSSGS